MGQTLYTIHATTTKRNITIMNQSVDSLKRRNITIINQSVDSLSNFSSDKVNTFANQSVGENHRERSVIKITQDPRTDKNTLMMIYRSSYIQLTHSVKNRGLHSVHIGGHVRGKGRSLLTNVMITFKTKVVPGHKV